ncbi:MAG: orotate phosphoribosyltransferase [Deltaproteobacteria bacterium]|nr:orotate phosphoribosyltransferase [Deltaproteobacteria bacterium]
MHGYKSQFIEFMLRCGALRFGDFTTKSGRETPYFIDTGQYRTGSQIKRLSEFYASAILERVADGFDLLFGPAYKGIALSVAVAIALYERTGRDPGFCFNRKESKDHGEKGALIGHAPRPGERVLIIEDVITAGTSIRETVPLLKAHAPVELAGLVVSVDRMERGKSGKNALSEISEAFAMPAFAIVTIDEIIEHLRGRELEGGVVLDDRTYNRVLEYRREYGGE